MNAVQALPATGAAPNRLGALARIELVRYAKHPLFLAGLLPLAFVTYQVLQGTTEDFYTAPMAAAFFLGVFGMVVGFRLTRSLERSAEAMGSAPVAVPERVGALLLTALLPATLGLVLTLAYLTMQDAAFDWVYGTWSPAERVAIFLAMGPVACLGGPILGIAAARWLRFPGAVVVPVVSVLGWVFLTNGYTSANQDSALALAGRMLSPFTFWATQDTQDGPHRVESWRGNPWFFLAWALLLCLLAALVALLKDAEGETRRRLGRALLVTVVLAGACYVLAVTTGADHTTVRSATGISGV